MNKNAPATAAMSTVELIPGTSTVESTMKGSERVFDFCSVLSVVDEI